MKFATKLLATMGAVMTLAAPMAHAADEIKIGFLVKQAEEPWFQDEWKFAEIAAKDRGFTLVKIGAPSGEKVMSAIVMGTPMKAPNTPDAAMKWPSPVRPALKIG